MLPYIFVILHGYYTLHKFNKQINKANIIIVNLIHLMSLNTSECSAHYIMFVCRFQCSSKWV